MSRTHQVTATSCTLHVTPTRACHCCGGGAVPAGQAIPADSYSPVGQPGLAGHGSKGTVSQPGQAGASECLAGWSHLGPEQLGSSHRFYTSLFFTMCSKGVQDTEAAWGAVPAWSHLTLSCSAASRGHTGELRWRQCVQHGLQCTVTCSGQQSQALCPIAAFLEMVAIKLWSWCESCQ
jgi:hypothetical protein